MHLKRVVLSLCFTFLLAPSTISGYDILGVFLLPSKSHFFVCSALMQGLANAGHNVTMLSPLLQKHPVNYEQIEITGSLALMQSVFENFFDYGALSKKAEMEKLQDVGIMFTNYTLHEKNTQNLMKSGRKFDLVIVEIFNSEALLGFGRHFNAKSVVGISTFGGNVWTDNLVANPSPLSFVPHPFLSSSDNMGLWERMQNTLMTSFEMLSMKYSYYPRQEKLFSAAFPQIDASFDQVMRNDVGLMLLNTHFTLGYPRPYLPNVIEVGGMNINRKGDKVLPEDLQRILDGATQGVIYFSMGSNIKCSDMDEGKRQALMTAFGKQGRLVLWKWDAEDFPKPKNVVFRPWFPQDAVLDHPNVKVFITHGGLLSTTEAIYFGKPVIGIPIFGDQKLNMKRATLAGYGVTVEYRNVSETAITWALETVLDSNEIPSKIKAASDAYRDQLASPVDTAVFWVEYMAKHGGAPHLQSHAKQLSFVQLHNIDVIAILAVVASLPVILMIVAISKLCAGASKPKKSNTVNKSKRKGE